MKHRSPIEQSVARTIDSPHEGVKRDACLSGDTTNNYREAVIARPIQEESRVSGRAAAGRTNGRRGRVARGPGESDSQTVKVAREGEAERCMNSKG